MNRLFIPCLIPIETIKRRVSFGHRSTLFDPMRSRPFLRFIISIGITAGLLGSACSDNNENPAPDMAAQDMTPDLAQEMTLAGCQVDDMSYAHGDEICQQRMLSVCEDGVVVAKNQECGDPFPVDIRVFGLRGGVDLIGGIDTIYVKGKIRNQGTMEATGVTCTVLFWYQGDRNPSRSTDGVNFTVAAGVTKDFIIYEYTGDIGNNKTAKITYSCVAENEGEEASMLGNEATLTFKY